MIYLVLMVSLFLNDMILLKIPYMVNDLSYFTPAFYLVAITLLYPFFNKNYEKYYLTIFLYGLIYDITNDTLFLNAIIFLLLGFIIINIRHLFMNNLINNIILVVLIISIYETLTYTILSFLNRINYNIIDLIYKIEHTIILNIIYTVILYILLNIISNKFNIKKID